MKTRRSFFGSIVGVLGLIALPEASISSVVHRLPPPPPLPKNADIRSICEGFEKNTSFHAALKKLQIEELSQSPGCN
jgi:hypothetical protein